MNKKKENILAQEPKRVKKKFFIYACFLAVLINLVFFISGIFSFDKISLLHSYYLFQMDSSFAFFSILTSLLSLIVLVFFYFKKLRENKQHKITSRYAYEYLVLFLLVFLCSTYFVSYRYGYALSAKEKIKSIDLIDYIDCANTSLAFLPMGFDRYEKENNTQDPNTKQEINSWAVNQDSSWKTFKVKFENSLRRVAKLNTKDIVFLNYYAFNPDHKRKLPYEEEYEKEVKAIKEGKKEYSYYYYRSKKVECELTASKEKDRQRIGSDVKTLLQSKNTKEIKHLLGQLQENLIMAGVDFRFNKNQYTLQAIKDSILSFDSITTIGQIGSERSDHKFINLEDYENFLQNSVRLKYGFNNFVWEGKNWLYLLLLSFALAFVVFMIRINGLVGVGTSLFVGSFLMLLIGALSQEAIAQIILSLITLILVVWGYKKTSKLKSIFKKNTLVNIGSIGLMLFGVSLFQAILSISKPRLEKFDHEGLIMAYQIVKHSDTYFWLNNNQVLLLTTYLVVLFLVVFLYFIPLSIKFMEN